MRIAVIAVAGEGALGTALVRAFASIGHETRLTSTPALVSGNRVLFGLETLGVSLPLERALHRRSSLRGIDLVVVIKGRMLSAGAIAALHERTGAPVVCWLPDDPLFPTWRSARWLESLRAYEHVFIWSDRHAAALRDQGIRSSPLRFGYDPEWYAPPQSTTEQRYDVAFVGQWSAERERYLRSLAGLSVAVAGSGWKRAFDNTSEATWVLPGRYFAKRAAGVYHHSRIGLNLLHPQNTGTHNMRTWELPATATAMVATASEEHRVIFGSGAARLVDSPASLRERVEELLAADGERRRLAQAGLRAVESGTYATRARELLAAVGA